LNNFSDDLDYQPRDFIVTIIEEHDQKLKFAIWEHMEFLSEEMKIDDPQVIIDTIQRAVEQYFVAYIPMHEYFEEGIEY